MVRLSYQCEVLLIVEDARIDYVFREFVGIDAGVKPVLNLKVLYILLLVFVSKKDEE